MVLTYDSAQLPSHRPWDICGGFGTTRWVSGLCSKRSRRRSCCRPVRSWRSSKRGTELPGQWRSGTCGPVVCRPSPLVPRARLRRGCGIRLQPPRYPEGRRHLRRRPPYLDRRPRGGFGGRWGRGSGHAGGDLVDQAPTGLAVLMGRRTGITKREIGLPGLALKAFNFMIRIHDVPRYRSQIGTDTAPGHKHYIA